MRRLGAGAAPPAFASLPADIQAQFAPVQQSLAADNGGSPDGDTLYFAQQNFANVLNTLTSQPQLDPSQLVPAAVNFCSLAHTASGAAQAIDGLVQEGITPGSVSGIVQSFTGTSMGLAGTVAGGAITLGVTLATAGVGAAIAVGVGILANLVGTMFSTPPPVATVGKCNLSYKPSFTIPGAFAWTIDGQVTASGPSTEAFSRWRSFPNPATANDAWWFQRVGFGGPDFVWNHGSFSDRWNACVYEPKNEKRPIDQACYENGANVYTQIECDLKTYSAIASARFAPGPATEVEVATASFQTAFVAAWKGNREYDFNGLARQADWQVLLQTVRFWNAAHLPGIGVDLLPKPFAPTGDDGTEACNTTSYAEMLIAQMQQNGAAALLTYSSTTGTGVMTSAGNLHLNTGPTRASANVGSRVAGLIGGAHLSTGKSAIVYVAGAGLAVAAGVLAWSYYEHIGYGAAWKRLYAGAKRQTTTSGQYLQRASLRRRGR